MTVTVISFETLVRQSIEQYKRDGRDHLQVAFGCTGNAPAAKRSGCLSARCTCREAIRFPDERSEEPCEARSQEGAREPRRGRKGPGGWKPPARRTGGMSPWR